MRILTATGEFNLPIEFEAELTRYNQMLNTAGDQTLPMTLPPSPNNLKLVEYSNRIDATYKQLEDVPVVVQQGISSRSANLGIHNADEEDGISCTLYMGVGEFYSLASGRKLASLTWPIFKSPTFNADNATARVQYLINLLKSADRDSNFVVCPVVTTQSYKYRVTLTLETPSPTINIDSVFILNWAEQYQNVLDYRDTGSAELDKYQGEYIQHVMDGDTSITLSLGYGMTPFIKLSYVLNTLFDAYGYTFDTRSIEDEINEFAGMFLINNVADAIYSGVLNYAQLLPDITIKDFIAELEKWFCGKFIFNSISKTVGFEFFKNHKAYLPKDLTPYIAGKLKPQPDDPANLVLNVNGSQDKANDQNAEFIELSYPAKKVVVADFGWIGEFDSGYTPYSFSMLAIDGIMHKNSGVQIDGLVTTEETANPTTVQIGFYSGNNISAYPPYIGYKTSYPMFGNGVTVETVLTGLYEDYIAFRKNSNKPYEIKMKIPKDVLERMDLHIPVLINNQKVLIEKITSIEGGDDNTQTLTIRTLRQYADRP